MVARWAGSIPAECVSIWYYIQVHCLPVRKRQGKLLEKQVRILGTGSVFEYGICKWRVVQPKLPIGDKQL